MTHRLSIVGAVLRGGDGWSELVIEHDLDGRIRISVHDGTGPGPTTTFDRADSDVIAAFIKGDR